MSWCHVQLHHRRWIRSRAGARCVVVSRNLITHLLHSRDPSFSIPTAYYLDVVSIGKCVQIPLGLFTISWRHIALTVYEHLLTLDTERRVIWGRKRSIPTMLFLSNRYLLWLYCLSSALWDLVQWESDKVSPPNDSFVALH